MRDDRPRFDLPWDVADRIAESVAAVGLVLLLVAGIVGATSLPRRVPIHFGFDGAPDRWGSPVHLLALPAIGLVLYALLSLLARFPHVYNYPWPITAVNARRQYFLARRLVILIKAYVVWLFLSVLAGSWRVATGVSHSFAPWIMLVAAGFLLATLVWYFSAARTAR